MKKKIYASLFSTFIGLILVACNTVSQNPETVTLHTGWQFSSVKQSQWRTATVPGTVHQDLLTHQLIPNPHEGTNEADIQWVEEEDWIYQTIFNVTKHQLKRDDAILTFKGLDTYADVYLNDSLILQADNMFIQYDCSVKPFLRVGENHLSVLFHSPIKQTLPLWESDKFNYPADNDHHEKHLSVYSRKAPYHYGWDWGLRMVTSGIWRPVYLTYYDKLRVTDFYVNQEKITSTQATLQNEISVNALCESEVVLTIEAERKDSLYTASRSFMLTKGENTLNLPLTIDNPDLWMPNGWGEPALYQFSMSISSTDGQILAEEKQMVGLRTIEVITEADTIGESFYFKVNGQPLYAKGANYIPNDLLLPRVTPEDYQQIFENVKSSNMNMLRVWGGGAYEDDYFYQLADENGILIWQDFMFACTPYPGDDDFLRKVTAEAEYNIKRLRKHASLAMWCGNNEILEALTYWGLQRSYNYTDSIMEGFFLSYEKIFNQLLPDKVKQLDGRRFYVHGSPYKANWGRLESFRTRDAHDWGIWYGRMPFEAFNARTPRFASEFGIQSFPELKTIATFADTSDYSIDSPVMKSHQKSYIGNDVIAEYIDRYYRTPRTFEDFVYLSMLMQGRGIRMGIEAQRRNRPYCMGSLYWQLNDCWPVVSWSGIDYYGNWKAMQYQAQRAFASPALSVVKDEEHETLAFHILSDEREPQAACCRYILSDFEGNVLKEKIDSLTIPANRSTCFAACSEKEWVMDESQRYRTFLRLILEDWDGNMLSEYNYYFAYPKMLELPASVELEKNITMSDGKCSIVLKSNSLLKDVFIEIPLQGALFSDNFFDLLPGEEKHIVITSPELSETFEEERISIHHLRETY